MRVLMIGWEFPPAVKGGLGFATLAIVSRLARQGVQLTLLLPFDPGITVEGVRIIPIGPAEREAFLYSAYHTPLSYSEVWKRLPLRLQHLYASSLLDETRAFAERVTAWLRETRETFDLVHAHDWLTLTAGLRAKQVLHAPLVVHVHATEYDRMGGKLLNTPVEHIERHGFREADLLLAVSKYTQRVLHEQYGIPREKIWVVYNGADHILPRETRIIAAKRDRKIILFVGRLTVQKGPLQFIRAMKRVIDNLPNTLILVAGKGELWDEMLAEAIRLGIADKVLLLGFQNHEALSSLYASADLVVMPSVSEPFGLTAVEAAVHGTPVIVSKQSGVAEVLPTLTVDFWDEERLAHYAIALLTHPPLQEALRTTLPTHAKRISWDETARIIREAYTHVLSHA